MITLSVEVCPKCGTVISNWRLLARQAFDEAEQIAGNRNRLAKLIGVSRQAINGWHRIVPVRRCQAVEEATGVKRKFLRPDKFRE